MAVLTLSEAFALTYRGITLNPAVVAMFGIPSAEVAQVVQPVASASHKPFMALVEEIHRQNLMHRLQERIRSAQTRADEHLLQQLEHELEHERQLLV
ncbi:MAG: hypothetical protein ACUVRV_08660 [Cyanobacteriota bacterium]